MTIGTALVLAWIHTLSIHNGVDPSFAKAVAVVESRNPKTGEMIRTGRLGQSNFYGPFGIHRSFLKKWDITNPFINCQVGVRALRGRDKRRILRRYNTKFNEQYYKTVMQLTRQFKKREGQCFTAKTVPTTKK